MAGHSIQTGVTDNDSNNGNNKRVDSLRSNGSIPTSELGKSFAARNINMATLAIQLTAQTSLVPELASGQFHHNRNYKWQQRPFSSTSLPLRPRNDTDNTSTADTSTVDNDESRSRLSSSRKTVTFNSEIDEIQIFDPSTTPESDSQIMDEPDELFAAGEDSDLSPDDDSAINIEIAKDNDGEDDENTNNDEQVSVDDGKQASACTMDGGSSSSSTVPTMVERDLRDEKSLLDARKAVQNRKGRISRDEVLNQLAKRKQIQGTWNSTQIPNFHPGPPINTTKSFQSVESQLMEAILKVKASNQYRAAAPAKTQSMPSLVSHNEKELGLATKMSFASYGDTPTQEPILLGYPSTPIDTTKNQDGDFGKSILNEFDKITSKQTKYYKARHNPTVVHASKTLIDDDSVDDSFMGENTSISSAVRMEPIWREFDTAQTSGHSSPSTDKRLQKGRLYMRVLAAENLDFPIQSDAPQIRCVLSNGIAEHTTEYHPMKHNISFDHDFSIDVETSSEFTITLVAGQPSDASTKSNQLRKLLGNRRRSRTDSILRYVNRLDGALAQTRVSLESIETQCRTKLCTASFALINGWYQYARIGGIIPMHKKDRFGVVPEKAVGKITVKLFFLPYENPEIENLPTSLNACEQALNIQRYSRTRWQTGFMSQLGGDVKFWRRRYFSLRGWRLFSYTDVSRLPRVIIDLSKAVTLAADHRIVVPPRTVSESSLSLPGSQQHQTGDRVSIISSGTTATSEDELVAFSVKNGFRITFINGESIDFFCDSAEERDSWLEVLKVIINRVPSWPDWMEIDEDREVDGYTETTSDPTIRLYPRTSQ